jgi:hypothetical protein
MGKVEEVAEALLQAEWTRAGSGGKRRVPWTEISPLDQERWRFLARAAIAAMWEPTEAMLAACGNGECSKWAPGAWQTMIDAALSEDKEQG